jgi:hypothetical protein
VRGSAMLWNQTVSRFSRCVVNSGEHVPVQQCHAFAMRCSKVTGQCMMAHQDLRRIYFGPRSSLLWSQQVTQRFMKQTYPAIFLVLSRQLALYVKICLGPCYTMWKLRQT